MTDSCCPSRDEEHYDTIPDYGTLCLESSGSKLYGSIMWPGGGFPRPCPCFVLLHGFPGSLPNGDLSHALCQKGFVVVEVHHRGAWGSEGSYLLSNCIEDAVAIVKQVRSKAFSERYGIDPGKVFLAGHSMGSCTVLNAAKRLQGLSGLLLITPFDPYHMVKEGNEEKIRLFLREGVGLRLEGEDGLYHDILSHAEEYSFENAFPYVKEQNLFFALGTRDEVAPPSIMTGELRKMVEEEDTKALQRFREYPAGHGLLGSRKAFIQDVSDFLFAVLTGNY